MWKVFLYYFFVFPSLWNSHENKRVSFFSFSFRFDIKKNERISRFSCILNTITAKIEIYFRGLCVRSVEHENRENHVERAVHRDFPRPWSVYLLSSRTWCVIAWYVTNAHFYTQHVSPHLISTHFPHFPVRVYAYYMCTSAIKHLTDSYGILLQRVRPY